MRRFRPRLTYANVMATIAVFIALGGGALAATSFVGSDGQIHGCVSKKGQLKVLKPGKQCKKHTTAISWNQRGPVGATGPSTGAAHGDLKGSYPAPLIDWNHARVPDSALTSVSASKVSGKVGAAGDSDKLGGSPAADYAKQSQVRGIHFQSASCTTGSEPGCFAKLFTWTYVKISAGCDTEHGVSLYTEAGDASAADSSLNGQYVDQAGVAHHLGYGNWANQLIYRSGPTNGNTAAGTAVFDGAGSTFSLIFHAYYTSGACQVYGTLLNAPA